jgi:hypothetical protein
VAATAMKNQSRFFHFFTYVEKPEALAHCLTSGLTHRQKETEKNMDKSKCFCTLCTKGKTSAQLLLKPSFIHRKCVKLRPLADMLKIDDVEME